MFAHTHTPAYFFSQRTSFLDNYTHFLRYSSFFPQYNLQISGISPSRFRSHLFPFLSSIMIFFEFLSPTPPHLNLMAPDRLLIPSSSALSSPTYLWEPRMFGMDCDRTPLPLPYVCIPYIFSDPFRPFHHINLFLDRIGSQMVLIP